MSRKRKKIRPIADEAPIQDNSAAKTKRLVIIIIAALVGAALLAGVIFGSVILIRNASYVFYADGVGVSEGVANYLATYFKAKYKAILTEQLSGTGITVTDTPAFWAKPVHEGVKTTYADYLRIYVEDAITDIAAANAIFNMQTSLTYDDKVELAVATEEILTYLAAGDRGVFNEECEKYGFDYNDFYDATEMLYKSMLLRSRLFGIGYEKMNLFSDECREFFSGYNRVRMIFIRTDKMIAYENGEPVIKEDGTYETVDIAKESAEYQNRMADIAKLQGIIDGEYDYALFDELWRKYEKENNAELNGCYLKQGTEFTAELNEKYGKVVSAALSLDEYEWVRVDDSDSEDENSFIGSTFIYRDKNETDAYSKKDEYGYFSDFYALAASEILQAMVDSKESEIEIRDKWGEVDLVAIPYLIGYVADF